MKAMREDEMTPLEERFEELDYEMQDILSHDRKNTNILQMHCEKEKIRDFLDKGETSETKKREFIWETIRS